LQVNNSHHRSDVACRIQASCCSRLGDAGTRMEPMALDQLRRVPSTETRIRPHSVDGWPRLASCRRERLSEVARPMEADQRI
jgi:hypothetical protein